MITRAGCARRISVSVAACFAIAGVSLAQPGDVGTQTPEYAARVINPKFTGSLYEPVSRTMLLWGTDGTILRSTDTVNWTYAITPIAADLASVVPSPDGKILIGVGAGGAILRSTDEGRRWSAAKAVAGNADLRALVHHESSGVWIAAGMHGTILRSMDTGVTWQSLDTGLDLTFETLLADPASGALLIGGEEGILGRSTDAGVSWNLTRVPMPQPVTPITAFHAFAGELIATSALGRLLTSKDGGATWELHSVGTNAYFTDLVFDPSHRIVLLASHTGDVFRRELAARNWERISTDGPKNYLSALRYDAASKSLFAAGHHGTLTTSSDGGRHWRRIDIGATSSLESLLHAGPGRFVAFGDGGWVLSSSDSGRSWRQVAPDLTVNLRELITLADTDVAIASGELGSVLRSTDSGATWKAIDIAYPNENTPPNLRSLVIEPREGALIAAGAPGTIIRSPKSSGAHWDITHWTPLEAEEAFPWILLDPTRQLLVVVEAHGSTYVSKDGGRTWQQSKVRTDSTNREFWHGAALQNPSVLLIAGQHGVVARSDDAAASWKMIESGVDADLFGSYADADSRNLFLMGAGGVLLQSTDAGNSWRRRASGVDRALRRMIRDPVSGALVSFGEGGSIIRSEDDGATWKAMSSGTDMELRKGLIEPGSQNLVIIGKGGVILRSTDAGRHWQALPSHTQRHFRSAAFHPRNGDLILVGERIVRMSRRPAPTSR